MISPTIVPHGNLGAYGAPCSEIDSVKAEISFSFTDTSGGLFTLTMPSEEFNLGPFHDDPSTCQTVINALPDFNIIGASILKYYCTLTLDVFLHVLLVFHHADSVWDVDNAQLGFSINGSGGIDSDTGKGGSSSSKGDTNSSSLISMNCTWGIILATMILSFFT